MLREIRVRFAPSPTGPLHIGGVRTALFNYLFAKKNNGTFFLRIEDTDQNRFVPNSEKYILDALEWLGISPTETVGKNEKYPPYRQSERKDIYKKYTKILIDSNNAYYSFDTTEELELQRKQAEEKGKTFIYNHQNREHLNNSLNLSRKETLEKIKNDIPYVIRFKTPTDRTLYLKDIIRGDIEFQTNLLDDKILFKSDGMPTYHLANVVDDHLMKTSHVIRGEEWLPSLPLHVLLYEAFDWETPEFAHLPLILKPIGNGKLSKRDEDKMGFPVFPLEWKTDSGISSGYKENGYFPETVINFLAMLGWNDGTEKEIFSLDELVESFDLTKVHKAGAKFDPEKNKWFNHKYLIAKEDKELANSFLIILKNKGLDKYFEFDKIIKIVKLIKERASFINEFWELSQFFFETPASYDDKAKKNWKEDTGEIMQKLISLLQKIEKFESLNIENTVKEWIEKNNLITGKIMQPFRLSLVGAMKGPHLFDIAEIIGKEETIKRIEKAIIKLEN